MPGLSNPCNYYYCTASLGRQVAQGSQEFVNHAANTEEQPTARVGCCVGRVRGATPRARAGNDVPTPARAAGRIDINGEFYREIPIRRALER